jgi:hypothetical protein
VKESYSTTASSNAAGKPYQDTEESLPAEQDTAMNSASTENDETKTSNLLTDGLEQGKNLLNEHKGKLAIGVAATLGLMVFYKWRDKKLAEEDPEEYARLQRLKAVVRANEKVSEEDEE